MESAAPPRASPSARERMMPLSADALVERLGDVDRVLAGQRIGDQ